MNILDCNSQIEVLLVQPEYGEEVKRRIFDQESIALTKKQA